MKESQGRNARQPPGGINHGGMLLTSLPTGQSIGNIFSTEVPFSQMTWACVKVTKTHQLTNVSLSSLLFCSHELPFNVITPIHSHKYTHTNQKAWCTCEREHWAFVFQNLGDLTCYIVSSVHSHDYLITPVFVTVNNIPLCVRIIFSFSVHL